MTTRLARIPRHYTAPIAGVPVRIRLLDEHDADLSVEGGSRVAGVDVRDGRRYSCTTGFVVTDASRTGIVTAAHCPDDLTYYDPDGAQVLLSFVGEWGALTRDVQIHVTSAPQRPEFYVDRDRKLVRPLTGARRYSTDADSARVATRADASAETVLVSTRTNPARAAAIITGVLLAAVDGRDASC